MARLTRLGPWGVPMRFVAISGKIIIDFDSFVGAQLQSTKDKFFLLSTKDIFHAENTKDKHLLRAGE